MRLSELRKALRSAGEGDRLATQAPGYVLRVTPGELDVLRFRQLAAGGREALAAGDAATAVRLLDEALALWRGPALADLGDLQFITSEHARLEEDRLGVLESRVDAQLMCGRHREAIAELGTLTTRCCGVASGCCRGWDNVSDGDINDSPGWGRQSPPAGLEERDDGR